MSSLENRLASRIDASVLTAIAPKVSGAKLKSQKAIIAFAGELLPELLIRAAITTPLRITHFLAQLAHESDGFCTTVEYATGVAYEGRKDLGNTKTGDGKRFKGHGLIQLTGRDNHRRFKIWLCQFVPDCPDFEVQPQLVAEFPWAVWAAIYYWMEHGINALADRDDLVAVTKAVNGGRNGLADRGVYLGKAKTIIATYVGDDLSASQKFAVLRRGMNGAAVEQLQRRLAAAGFYFLSIDADFGAGTEGAVRTFQRSRGLTIDGVVGNLTAEALAPFDGAI